MSMVKERIDLAEKLEAMVDKHGLAHVLCGLELVCLEKAEHLRSNWQDFTTDKAWDAASRACYAAARKIKV